MVARAFVGVALPLVHRTEAYVAQICNRQPSLSLEYQQRKGLNVVFLTNDVIPKLDLIYQPMKHFGYKGTKSL